MESVIHKGVVIENLLELCSVCGQVTHSEFATYFFLNKSHDRLIQKFCNVFIHKFTLISTFPGSFFTSTFQRNHHVSQFVSIESFPRHAESDPEVHPIYQHLVHGFPKLRPDEQLKTAMPLRVAHKKIS